MHVLSVVGRKDDIRWTHLASLTLSMVWENALASTTLEEHNLLADRTVLFVIGNVMGAACDFEMKNSYRPWPLCVSFDMYQTDINAI